MKSDDFAFLLNEVRVALAVRPDTSFAILGHTPTAYDLIQFFRNVGAEGRLFGVYADLPINDGGKQPVKPIAELSSLTPDYVVVASDNEKELLIEAAQLHLRPPTKMLLSGYGHFGFHDNTFDQLCK